MIVITFIRAKQNMDANSMEIAAEANVNIVNIRNTPDIVDFLINKCIFSSLTYEDKLYVVKDLKRPVPDLSKSLINVGVGGKSNRAFSKTWYEKYDWLTGSVELSKLFCWPCILFANNSEKVWCKNGYSDLKNLSRGLALHNKSSQHISSNCKLVLMSKQKQNIATAVYNARKIEIENFNSRVTENRKILRSLIDITMHLCMQELPFRGHDESVESPNRGNFKELVTLVSKYDPHLRMFLEKDNDVSSVFSGTSKTSQNELIDSIAFIINKKIEAEISKKQLTSVVSHSCLLFFVTYKTANLLNVLWGLPIPI